MPRNQSPGWTFGRKVQLWLADCRVAGTSPSSVAALARAVGVSQPTMQRYTRDVRVPPADVAVKVAALMGATTEYLLDATAPYPPSDAATSLDVAWSLIPPEDRAALRAILANPSERRAWIAAWRERRRR